MKMATAKTVVITGIVSVSVTVVGAVVKKCQLVE